MVNNKFKIVQSIPNMNAKSMLIVEHISAVNEQYVLVAEDKKRKFLPLIHVYGTKDGKNYNKVSGF